jgi:heme/copper-type cytochrome/quinol oxidase subunit 4
LLAVVAGRAVSSTTAVAVVVVVLVATAVQLLVNLLVLVHQTRNDSSPRVEPRIR